MSKIYTEIKNKLERGLKLN